MTLEQIKEYLENDRTLTIYHIERKGLPITEREKRINANNRYFAKIKRLLTTLDEKTVSEIQAFKYKEPEGKSNAHRALEHSLNKAIDIVFENQTIDEHATLEPLRRLLENQKIEERFYVHSIIDKKITVHFILRETQNL